MSELEALADLIDAQPVQQQGGKPVIVLEAEAAAEIADTLRAAAKPFIPDGADLPLPAAEGAEEITEAEVDEACRVWDSEVPERFRGLCEAEELADDG